MAHSRLIKKWEFELKNGEKLIAEDCSYKEAVKLIEEKYTSPIIGYKQISDLEDDEIIVTNISLSYGITLYSKNNNKLPLYRMISNQFTEIDLNNTVFKNDPTTYRDLLLEKYEINNKSLIKRLTNVA